MAKGQGAIFYIDVDNDDQYINVGCIFNLKPPGMSRGTVPGEACLADLSTTDETGELRYTPIAFTLRAAPNAAIQASIELVMTNDTAVKWAIKHPLPTPIYQLGTAKVSEFTPQDFQREQEMKVDVELVPNAAYTYSTTAPTLEA